MSFGPKITTQSPLVSAVQGVPYFVRFNGTGGTPSYTYALVSGSLAAGLTFNSSGTISGTPTVSETDVIGIRLTDANGLASSVQSFVLTTVPNIFLAGETLPLATQNVFYTQDISGQASGGTPPYTFSLISATGTDVWSVSASGVISGTPGFNFLVTETGAFLVTETGNNLVT